MIHLEHFPKTAARTTGTLLVVLTTVMFAGCDKASSGDEPESSQGGGGSAGGGKEITINDLDGHWMDTRDWTSLNADITAVRKYADSMSSYDIISTINPVYGFYISASKSRVYYTCFEATTTKYDNNSVAGNKVIASFTGSDLKTVYVMNTGGGKNNDQCMVVNGKSFTYMGFFYTIKNASTMIDSKGNTFIKVSI